MSNEDEFALKEWLFEMWKKTRRHEFFLAGCVVGKVPDAYGLAKRYGIKREIAWKFFDRLGIPGVILRDRDRFTIFNCLELWARNNDVPPKIAAILHYAKDEKILVFVSSYYTLEITGNKDVTLFEEDMPKEDEFERWRKKLLKALEEERRQTFGYQRELFIGLVSRTQTARAYEKMLRSCYEHKTMIQMGEISLESLPSLNYRICHFYAEDIEKANTPDEMFALWKTMRARLLDIEEILAEVGKRIDTESSKATYFRRQWKLEHFLDFVKLWEISRKNEFEQLEGKANSAGVDFEKMFQIERVKDLKNVKY